MILEKMSRVIFNEKCKRILFFTALLIFSAFVKVSLAKQAESGGKICLFFDDGWENQYDYALPVLQEFGFKASFGIITDYIGLDGGTFWGRMNVSELKELERSGMEITSHSKTHPHMLNLTHEQLYNEIIGSKTALTQMGFTVDTFVYPYGEWNSTVIKYVEEAGYLCARALACETYSLDNTDPLNKFHVGSWSITNQGLNEFKEILAHSTENEVVVLVYHFISDEGPESTSTPIRNFYDQMKYLEENGFNVIILSEIFQIKEKSIWEQPYIILASLTLGFALILLVLYFRSRMLTFRNTVDSIHY
jgi:peptidoglycan/xylan/chitin deacetylase (PgdA/CDA1 family)